MTIVETKKERLKIILKYNTLILKNYISNYVALNNILKK